MAEELLRKTFRIHGGNFDTAGETSTEIKEILKALHIRPDIIRRAVVVTFEAEMNVVMYADIGTLNFVITEEEIQIEMADEGPGIPDIDLAMQEGFSTASDEMRERGFGFGMGLPNMRKHSDFLEIQSRVGKGTTVAAQIRLKSNA